MAAIPPHLTLFCLAASFVDLGQAEKNSRLSESLIDLLFWSFKK
jgi:hypothetical protein